MPLRRLYNAFSRASPPRHSDLFDQDVFMTDAALSAVASLASPPPSFPSPNGFGLLGKRRHEECSDLDAPPTSRLASSKTPDASHSGRSPAFPSPAEPSTPTTRPLMRPKLSLDHIDTHSDCIPGPSSSSQGQEPASPTPTEIALDLGDAPQTPEERIECLRAAGIKVRDFAFEPMPNSSKAPEVFDPVPSLIAADWHMRNPRENHGLLTAKGLFRLLRIGWLSIADVRKHFHPREYSALAQYNERPDEQRYPFVVPPNERMPTPSQRVRMRRKVGLRTNPDDIPDSDFFGYDPTGDSDDGDGPPPRVQPEGAAVAAPEAVSASRSQSRSGSAAGEPTAKRRKVKGTGKTRGRAKPLRREWSRPEV